MPHLQVFIDMEGNMGQMIGIEVFPSRVQGSKKWQRQQQQE
jgi:hypothetical protein